MLARQSARPRSIDVSSVRGGQGGKRYCQQTFDLSLFYDGRSGRLLFFRNDAHTYKGADMVLLRRHGRPPELALSRDCHLGRDGSATKQVRTPLLQVASGS